MQGVLGQFEEVFYVPEGIPPIREHEHVKVLKEGFSPINMRPNRYP